jgi:predicted nucleotidyltransferase
VSEPDLEQLKSTLRGILAEDPSVRFALLFGSHARGRATPQSDVDLAVGGANVDTLTLSAKLSEALGCGVDVLRVEDANIPLLQQLMQHAQDVYSASTSELAFFRSRTLAQLETDLPWYRRMRDASLARIAARGLVDG